MLASAEWRRMNLVKRSAAEEKRLEKQLDEMKQKETSAKQRAQQWEKGRDQRVHGWRTFMKTKGGGAVKKTGIPKARAHDEDKLYVRRAVKREGDVED